MKTTSNMKKTSKNDEGWWIQFQNNISSKYQHFIENWNYSGSGQVSSVQSNSDYKAISLS